MRTCAIACGLASIYDNTHNLTEKKKVALYCGALGTCDVWGIH